MFVFQSLLALLIFGGCEIL